MGIKKILKSKYYPRIMFLLILTTLILIFFNIGNIYESANTNKTSTKHFTGYAISDENKTNNTNNSDINNPESNQLYSEKTYAIFYLFLIVIVGFIGFIFVILILPQFKKWT